MNKFSRPKGHHLLIAIVLISCLGAAPALASSPIERVWEFRGGKVAVHELTNGTFEGVVVAQTTFDQCPHEVGEAMWTEIRQQPDGSYWGHHRWFFENSHCAPNQTPGLTAWRVLANAKGEFLKVCFSLPEEPAAIPPVRALQPTIARDGTDANATFGCKDSASIAKTPGPENVNAVVGLPAVPGPKACVSVTALTIKLHEPKYDPLKEAIVWVKGHKVSYIHGVAKLRKGIRLTKLPSGNYTIKVSVVTVLGHKLTGSRKYKSCAAGSGNIGLKSAKHHSKKHHKKG